MCRTSTRPVAGKGLTNTRVGFSHFLRYPCSTLYSACLSSIKPLQQMSSPRVAPTFQSGHCSRFLGALAHRLAAVHTSLGFSPRQEEQKNRKCQTAPLQSLPPPLPVQTRRWLLEPAFSNPVHTPASPSKSGVLANDDQAFRGGLNYYSGHSMRLVTGSPPSPSSTDPASHPYTDTERNGAPIRGEGATHGDSRKPGV